MKISNGALGLLLEASRSLHPKEFTGQLRIENDTITEVLIIPASTFGEGFAITRLDMVPIDYSILGTVHSHPGDRNEPSRADLRYFRKRGNVHLIVRYPYGGLGDVAAYDNSGERVDLELE